MTRVLRGRLLVPTDGPAVGERSEEVAQIGTVAVEHILSGALVSPVDYDQAHDEWVVVLEGQAILEVDEQRHELGRGDWVLLPAHVPHRLIETRPGTSWLALRNLA